MSNKILISTILFLILIAVGFIYYQQAITCNRLIAYDIGVSDNRFNLEKDKFIKTIKEAEVVWESTTGKDLFNYIPGSKFKVNLFFDERQAKTIEADKSKENIVESRDSYDQMVLDYKNKEAEYQDTARSYELMLGQFNQKLSYYNAKVTETNKQGGAKPAEFKQLEQEKVNLEEERSYLEKARASLNTDAAKLNYLVGQINQLGHTLNIEVDIHNQRFGEPREFDQGEYRGNEIDIYQFESISDLRLVLAHEFGHALGIGHVENPESMMYYLMDKQNPNNPTLSKEDVEAFNKRCELHIPKIQEFLN